ncbi:MAG: hypothetical protein V4550_11665 [Gemmatimonadota bacterium]
MHNGMYWRHVFRDSFVKEIRAFHDVTLRRFLPTFDNLEAEADAVTAAEYERLGQCSGGDGDSGYDMADAAEDAHEEGLEHYQRLTSVRQGLLNLVATGLYHLFEQQAGTFTRRQLLTVHEERNEAFMRPLFKGSRMMAEMNARLLKEGIDPSQLPTWHKVDELRLVANTIKHGPGGSAQDLYALAPLLFTSPDFRPGMPFADMGLRRLASAPKMPRVDRPLGGEDIYITAEELTAYCESLVAFWHDLGDAIAN